jgi:RecQ family ATP-dependent DNA helicase
MAVATAAASTVATVAASTHPGRPRVLMTTPFLLPSLASTQLRTSPSKYQGTCVIAVTPTLQPKSLDRTTGVATVSENASNSRPTKKTPLVAPKSRPVSAPVVTPTTAKKVLLVPMSRPVTIPRSNGPVSQPVSKIVSVDVPLPNTGSAAFAPRSKTHVPLRKLPVVDVPPTSRRTSEAPMALIRTVAPKFLGAPKAMSPVSFVNPTSDDCIPSLRTVTSEKKASEKKTVDGINKKVSPLPKCSVKQRALALLKKHWGYTEFRAHQYEIISQALNGRDCMVVMATGSGKSICYQLPALLHGRPTIVVSPLISLMEDQCRSLHAAGISACHLSSSQTDSEVWHKARRGEYALIYMAPERIETWSEGLAALARDGGITSFAIDEAHSISEWGHDFRTSYRELGVHLRARFPRIPIVAFTATATERVQTDIVTNLRLRTPYVVRTGFDRPNLTYRVRALASTSAIFDALIRELNRTVASTSSPVDIINSDETVTDVKSDGEGEGGGGYSAGNVEIKDNGAASAESCVIYCMTKKKTTEVVAHLLSHGIRAAAYHAGLSSQTRSKVHRDYFKDNVRIIVATVAFGMGIDKPDIRRVIHLGVPKSIEAYYQQTGRAGRDGAPSDCLLLYAPRDFTIGSFLSGSSTNDAEMLAAMRAYLITDRCRRAVLLRYFDVGDDDATATAVANHDGADIPTNCANCDNCLAPAVALVDRFECTVEARHLACAVRETRERFGMAVPCAIVRGSTASKVSGKVRNVERLKSFGTLRHRSEKYVRALSQMLVNARVLEQFTRAKFSLYRVGDVGRRLLNDPRYTLPPLVPSSEMSAELRLLLRSRGTTHSSTAPVSRRVSATQECDSRVSVTQECDSTDAKSESKVSVVSEQSTASELVEWLCQQGVKPESDAKDEHAALWRQAHKQLTQVARQQKRDTDLERKLYVLLTILRKTEADMRGVAPYQILGALTLTALAKYKPTTIEAFRSIEGVSEAGHAFAERFTQAISTFAKTHGINVFLIPPARHHLPFPTQTHTNNCSLFSFLSFSLSLCVCVCVCVT